MTTTATASTKRTALTNKINSVLSLDKITQKDIAEFSARDCQRLGVVVTNRMHKLSGEQKDQFLDKMALIMPADTKSRVWDYNHAEISRVVSNYIKEYNVMPSKTEIAELTRLSRRTVITHFKEHRLQPEFAAQMEQFKYMSHKILACVFKCASHGDIRAARLYFEMTGDLNKSRAGTVVNEQNNYIQINNTILSQENLKQLSAEQLNQIENIITQNPGHQSLGLTATPH